MKRQLKSILAGLLCVACLPVIPVDASALDWTAGDYVVVGLKEDYCILANKGGETYSIYRPDDLLPEGSDPVRLGDMVRLGDGWCGLPDEIGNGTGSMAPMITPEPGEALLYQTGYSVLWQTEVENFTVTELSDCCWLTDGENDYCIRMDWMDRGYEQLGYVDWSEVEAGDKLRCYVIGGVPVAAITEVKPQVFVVLGVAENGDCIVLDMTYGGGALELSGKQLAEALPEDDKELSCGDVIQFADNVGGEQTALGGNAVNSMRILVYGDWNGEIPLEPGMVYKIGSVLEDMETADYLITEDSYGSVLSDGEWTYHMVTSWQYGDRYQKLNNIDWRDVVPGDTLECIVYQGRPVIALDVAATSLDENGESLYEYTWGNTDYAVYRLFTDDLKYINRSSCYYYYPPDDAPVRTFYEEKSELRIDAVNANCVVTGIFCAPGETKPAYYTVNTINDGVYFDHSANVDASELERYLGDQVLEIGDLLYMDYVWQDSNPRPCDVEFHHVEDGYTESVVEYVGNGVELLGEDFKRILRHELRNTPALREGREGYYLYTANDLFEKGKITDDDEIDIVDCIALNKYLMTGEQIGYCGQLAADVDNNGVVNATDSLNLLKYVVKIIDSFEEIQN